MVYMVILWINTTHSTSYTIHNGITWCKYIVYIYILYIYLFMFMAYITIDVLDSPHISCLIWVFKSFVSLMQNIL